MGEHSRPADQLFFDLHRPRDLVLDHTRVAYSYKQQCLVNITVDGVPGVQVNQSEWHLPTFDPHNQNKYHYRLHSLDIYFWTQTDALQFVNGIRRVLPPDQVEVADEPPPPPLPQQQQHHHQHPYGQSQDAVNPLVQKLEHVAVSDPTYSSPKPTQQGAPTFAPPPAAAPATTNGGGSSPQQQQQQPQQFAPMAYNPAAPAAPEQIQHREKTPPPLEADGYDPLAAAVARDHGVPAPLPAGATQAPPPPFSPGFPPGTTSAPPHQHQGIGGGGVASPGLPPPPTQFGHLQRSATVPVSGLTSPGLVSPGLMSPGLASPGLASPYGTNFPGSPGFAPPPPPPSGGLPAQGQGYHNTQPHQPTPPPVQSPGLQPPPGGYAQYNYGAVPNQPAVPSDYSVHQQVYRPMEAEAYNAKYGEDRYKPGAAGGTGDGKPSRLGQNAERLEKGVTGMLKRFEKKFG